MGNVGWLSHYSGERMLLRGLILCALLLSSMRALAQAAPSAYGGSPRFTAGGLFSYVDSGYAGNRMTGPGAYIDWSPPTEWSLGLEGEARWLILNAPNQFRQYTYLAGPRYQFPHKGRVRPYVKFLIGAGDIDFPYHLAHGSYFVLAPGGGADIALAPKLRLRADYELQIWPQAVGIPGIPGSSLKPNGVSVGFSYKVF